MAEQALENQIVKAAKIVEECVDAEIDRLDRMDSDELEKLREQRRNQMKKQAQKRQEWLAKGHGKYSEVPDQKSFFDETRSSERVVCHFYRESTFRCKIFDKHLSIIAAKHIETKFIKIEAEKSMFLCERLGIKVLPTLALIKDGKTKGFIVGFDDLGGVDEFPTEMLEWRLGIADIIDYSGDKPDLKVSNQQRSIFDFPKKKGRTARDEDDDDDDDY